MNRASSATGWVRNPVMKSPDLDLHLASSYDLGYTLNPFTGCLNQTNGLCNGGGFPCYAYRLANGRLKQRYLANTKIPGNCGAVSAHTPEELMVRVADPFYPRLWPERLEQPFEIKGSAGIFVCDMSDLFGIGIPHEWTEAVMNVIKIADRHRFYLLTKQPQNLIKFSPFPDNCWVGVTATDKHQLTLGQHYLSLIDARIKYISFEPLLEQMTTTRIHFKGLGSHIDWVIIGAQTKPYKPPEMEWVFEIVEACDKAGVKVFLKDNLRPLYKTTLPHGLILKWEGGLRQELPDGNSSRRPGRIPAKAR